MPLSPVLMYSINVSVLMVDLSSIKQAEDIHPVGRFLSDH